MKSEFESFFTLAARARASPRGPANPTLEPNALAHKVGCRAIAWLIVGAAAVALAQMPSWLDFPHSATTHHPMRPIPELMTDADVASPLPVLVVLLEFDDLAAQAGNTPAHFTEIFFDQNRWARCQASETSTSHLS
jgi:hypothetical protein